jgi:hypothetical protein
VKFFWNPSAVCGATTFLHDALGVDQPLAVAGATRLLSFAASRAFLTVVPNAHITPVPCNVSDYFWQNSITVGEQQPGDRFTRLRASLEVTPTS